MPPDPNKDEKILEKYTINLNKQAELDKLDPIIGRSDEINRIIRILSRKTKNNPVLIGEPGVGKTAIVEGLAQRIVKQDVPRNLKDKIIYQLDMGALIAGAKFQGEFEDRLKAVLNKIKNSDNTIILFIDELHLIVGAGRTQGSMDASNLLKPMLAKGELRCIGSTTLDEHREYIEKDAALERRFQKVLVKESTVDDTISILRGLKERFEAFHGVIIHDNALVAAAKMSHRYITDRYLPDKAIDLIDEASAGIKTQIGSQPASLDSINRKIIQLKIEKAALKKEQDTNSLERLTTISNELKILENQAAVLNKQWKKESNEIKQLKDLKEKIEQLKMELDKAPSSGNFARAGEIQYSLLPKLYTSLKQAQKNNESNTLIREDVTEIEIANIVEKWTGIPVQKLVESEQSKILSLPQILQERVKGQSKAIQVLTDAILRSRSGIKDPNKPIGCFLFLGGTGVGKTEIARSLSDILFDSTRNMIRFDMSEYMEKHSVSNLIGSPPGYIGYEKGGRLTEAVRRKPYSIVLFDEIEKAHPDVINILLQIMDDGQLQDKLHKTIDFKNTIIILTSNLGSEYLMSEQNEDTGDLIQKELARVFKPELINRIDNVVTFNTLSRSVVKEIIERELNVLKTRVLDLKNINVNFTSQVSQKIFDESYSREFGARPIKRYIQQNIETALAAEIIRNKLKPHSNYVITVTNDKFEIMKKLKLN